MAKSLQDFVREAEETVTSTPAGQLDGALVIDVREEDEYQAGHVPGAIHIPRSYLEVKADLQHPKRDPLLANRSQRVVCYCNGGTRQLLSAKTLQEMGFEDVTVLEGGYRAWDENAK